MKRKKYHYEWKAVRNDGVVLAQNRSFTMCAFDANVANCGNSRNLSFHRVRVSD